MVGAYGRELATTQGLANVLGNLTLYGVPLSEMNTYSGKVEAVTAAEVPAFARDKLDPASISIIVAG